MYTTAVNVNLPVAGRPEPDESWRVVIEWDVCYIDVMPTTDCERMQIYPSETCIT